MQNNVDVFLLNQNRKVFCLHFDLVVGEIGVLDGKKNVEAKVFEKVVFGQKLDFVDFFLLLVVMFDVHGHFFEVDDFVDEIVHFGGFVF